MKSLSSHLPMGLALTAALAAPTLANAAPARVECTVAIDYVDASKAESYAKTFQLTVRDPFVDDFSTATRQKEFSASLARVDGLVVSINYFNDVGTFDAVDFSTSLRIRGVDVTVSTNGRSVYSNSAATPAGNHATSYDLTCHRMDPLAP
ncbi:MAG: hypothetical protein KDH15_17750 [Rhodocyclaceae bacterium]|nr:hypothetical protein [Rhodocyclaceae bacterium]